MWGRPLEGFGVIGCRPALAPTAGAVSRRLFYYPGLDLQRITKDCEPHASGKFSEREKVFFLKPPGEDGL